MRPLLVTFVGGETGPWVVERLDTVAGKPLDGASRLEVAEGPASSLSGGEPAWLLRGVTSNDRYVSGVEHTALVTRQESLGRAASTRAALIPITKSDVWWELPQAERRRIFEESSHHVATGLEYLPAVARRLHHGRDLGEPFDFLTWSGWRSCLSHSRVSARATAATHDSTSSGSCSRPPACSRSPGRSFAPTRPAGVARP